LEHVEGTNIFSNTRTSYTYLNLQPLVEYTFNISILALLGNGPPSAPITFVTPSDNCKYWNMH